MCGWTSTIIHYNELICFFEVQVIAAVPFRRILSGENEGRKRKGVDTDLRSGHFEGRSSLTNKMSYYPKHVLFESDQSSFGSAKLGTDFESLYCLFH